MQYLVHNFISLAIDRYTKHFNKWWTTNLPLAIAGEPLLATRLVCWFLEKAPPPLPSTHLPSKEHRTTIDVESMINFFTVGKNIAQYSHHHIFDTFRPALNEIANGNELWVSDCSENMTKFKNYIKNAWLIVPSNTQLCERWVKDSNECVVTGRSERLT